MTRIPIPTGDNLRILYIFYANYWAIAAIDLRRATQQLNPRGRISELRHRFGLRIDATWEMVEGRKHTTYTLHPDSRKKATRFIVLGLEAEKKSRAKRNRA